MTGILKQQREVTPCPFAIDAVNSIDRGNMHLLLQPRVFTFFFFFFASPFWKSRQLSILESLVFSH